MKKFTLALLATFMALTISSAYASMDEALVTAASTRKPNSVAILLSRGANPNAKAYGINALTRAFQTFEPQTIVLLLEAGADLNAQNDNGTTALDAAKAGGWGSTKEEILNTAKGMK